MKVNPFSILVLLSILIVVVFAGINMRPYTRETFENMVGRDSSCPISASRQADGTILVQPQNKVFQTLPDYVAWLSSLYDNGSQCIPPTLAPNREEPTDGLFGGLGNSAEPPSAMNRQGAAREVLNTDLQNEQTSAKTPINKLDDYEYTRVYQSERPTRNATSQSTLNELMGTRTLDWANLPFNSEERAKQEDTFIAGRLNEVYKDPESKVFFKNVTDEGVLPPDVEAEKLREAKLLAAYRPTAIDHHKIDDESRAVANLVEKMYQEDPNWLPVVEKTGENQYQVTELLAKPRKERWEEASAKAVSLDERQQSQQSQPTPHAELTISDQLQDPYFEPDGVADRTNNRFWNYNDFRKWTPGLERMFAPTQDKREWS